MAGLSLMAVPFSFDFGLQISSFCVIISTSKLVGFIGCGKSDFTPEVPQTSENFCPRSENGCGYMRSLKIWWNKQRLWELMPYHERLWETQRASRQWSLWTNSNSEKPSVIGLAGARNGKVIHQYTILRHQRLRLCRRKKSHNFKCRRAIGNDCSLLKLKVRVICF